MVLIETQKVKVLRANQKNAKDLHPQGDVEVVALAVTIREEWTCPIVFLQGPGISIGPKYLI